MLQRYNLVDTPWVMDRSTASSRVGSVGDCHPDKNPGRKFQNGASLTMLKPADVS